MRIAPLFLATSLATLLLSHLAMSGSAQAAAMDPREVTIMLARAQTIDSRCKVLSANESQDLRDLVAKAEIALASKYSVMVARQTLAKGRAAGKAVACDTKASADVHDILKAGVQATTQEPAVVNPEQVAAAAPVSAPQVAAAAPTVTSSVATTPKPSVAQKPVAPAVKRIKPVQKLPVASQTKTTTKLKTEKKVRLIGYADLAEKYYVELKCRNMSLPRVQRMYDDVLAQHRAAVAKNGASAVRRMLKNAQSRAGAQSCA